ncbi:MAG: homoserine O-acetyltransferase [Dehalococcoidia bacterium]|nr:homoserine O-acetyltransferase [Dehalococcoidia bacterium]
MTEKPPVDGCSETKQFTFASLPLESGEILGPVTLAYETWGTLNRERSNAILICHALTGNAHATSWWETMVGQGKAFDTERYFVICSNVIGGCHGSTGPSSQNPTTGKPYGLDFPVITIGDMAAAQEQLINHLGIEKLLAVAGGSMGGMQALSWTVKFPSRVKSAVVIASAVRHSPQQIAFNEVGRQAIMADPHFNKGQYYNGNPPERGLATARMVGHITYMSDQSMEGKFGRRFRENRSATKFGGDFAVAGYLQYKGDAFVQRFDANSYLYITQAVDLFDLTALKTLPEMLQDSRGISFLVLSFRSDWLYPSAQSKELVRGCKLAGIDVTYAELSSTYGHDAFLLETEEETPLVGHFLRRIAGSVEIAGHV